jgi:hypothetical protein
VTIQRPTLVAVDDGVNPPTMLLRFDGPPRQFVSVRIKTYAYTREALAVVAAEELQGFTPEQIDLLADVAQPDPAEPPALEAAVVPVERLGFYSGRIHCPGCGAFVALAESPAIGYMQQCPHCRRELRIRVNGDTVAILLRPAPPSV